jgi:hypothetical protein
VTANQQVAVAPVWTTPQILKTGLMGIWLTSLLLMVAAIVGARSHRHAMQVVGRDSAPSIIAAQHIRAALADMDSDAASELLTGINANAAATARQAFERRRAEATSALVEAAKNITYGDAERKPIEDLALGMGTYMAQIQTARDRREASDKGFLTAWREASGYLGETLLPAAGKLDEANRDALDEAYGNQTTASKRAMAFLIVAALALGAVLFSLQIFLLGRMRRVLNPMLFLATLIAWIFVVYAGRHFKSGDDDLKVAKQDAFDSIHLLWQARALGYSANGDQNRASLDPSQRTLYDRDFAVKTKQIADDFLTKELNNITFEGEREPAEETMARFAEYRTAKSAAAFAKFDEALGRTLEVNKNAFDAAVVRGFKDVDAFEIVAPAAALLISLLAWLGLRPRIREYAG